MAEGQRSSIGWGRKWVISARWALIAAAVASLVTPAAGLAVDTPMSDVTEQTGAQAYWESGYTGAGVDIAVIDTGTTEVGGLDAPGKILYAPDLSFDSQSPTLHQRDAFGHGTHIAGIAAGRDGAQATGRAYASDPTGFYGMAPDARIVNVKVGDAEGAVDVSQVIAAVDWVVAHHDDPGTNIRVLVLAYGTDGTEVYDSDPLVDAIAQAWKAGIVVVVAAGNTDGGRVATGLTNPARAPFAIAVGAADTKGTLRYSDDRVATFSASGTGYGEYARDPDLVAPGVSILGLRVPGSFIDEANGATATKDGRFFRGSGTSQATAVVAGAAALVLDQRPDATPDQVKALLEHSARWLRRSTRHAQGAGELDLRNALHAATPRGAQSWIPTRGDGSLNGSRGSFILTLDAVALDTDVDVWGVPYDSAGAAALRHAGQIWDQGRWRGIQLVGDDAAAAAAAIGPAAVWEGRTWSGRSWADFAWTGRSWQGRTWAGRSWAGRTWAGRTWAGRTWAGATSGPASTTRRAGSRAVR